MGDWGYEDCSFPCLRLKTLLVDMNPYAGKKPLHESYRRYGRKVAMFSKIIKKTLPWLIALGIFTYLFYLYSPSKILSAITYINLIPFILFSIIYFSFIYVIDSLVITKAFKMFSKPIPKKDIFIARGVTYLIMIINYAASQAGFAYYLKRKHQTPIFDALGVFLIIVFIDLMWVCTFALIGSFFQEYSLMGINLGYTVKIAVLIAYVMAISWIMFWHFIAPKLHANDSSFMGKILKRKAFSIFMKAKFFDYFKIAIWRAPIHIAIILSMFIILQTFNCYIPFTKILGNMPLVLMASTLPITPGGLGTSNVATVELLAPYLTGNIVAKVGAKQILFAASLALDVYKLFIKSNTWKRLVN